MCRSKSRSSSYDGSAGASTPVTRMVGSAPRSRSNRSGAIPLTSVLQYASSSPSYRSSSQVSSVAVERNPFDADPAQLRGSPA
ncbi:hypothetical protein N8I87_07895 [Streptomyces sp. HUAS TT20]|nr:hypothetical protein [Streptomyces sp. HUAS 15-9]UXY26501.1 hypothetical protein N8I87_07895 [Streptomyces sp. HUAS 15-9]